jgi:hypothetical protein
LRIIGPKGECEEEGDMCQKKGAKAAEERSLSLTEERNIAKRREAERDTEKRRETCRCAPIVWAKRKE